MELQALKSIMTERMELKYLEMKGRSSRSRDGGLQETRSKGRGQSTPSVEADT